MEEIWIRKNGTKPSLTVPQVFPTTAPGNFTWCDEAKKVLAKAVGVPANDFVWLMTKF